MAKADITIHENTVPRPTVVDGMRIREDVLFTDRKGQENRSQAKNAGKLLARLSPVLNRVLGQDEAVLYAARMLAPCSLFEQFTFGWYVYYIGAVVLVFTNRRILHLRVDSKGNWLGVVRAVAYGDLAEAKAKGFLGGTLELKYRDGKKEKYWAIKGRDKKKLQVLLPAVLSASTGEGTERQGMVSLCPECLAALTPQVYVCGGCGLIFKDEKTMVRRSLWIPGGGYFYARQNFLGVLDFMAECYILLLFAVSLLLAVASWGEASTNPDDMDAAGALILAAILGGALALEKLLTIHHGRRFIREFISTGEKDPIKAQAAMSAAAGGGFRQG